MASYQIIVYRVTLAGDLITNVVDKIVYNDETNKKTNVENAFIEPDGLTIIPSEGIGNNQSAEKDLSGQQALGRFEKIYELRGFITLVEGTFGDGQNAFVNIMEQWESEAKQLAPFIEGRHGIQIDYLRDYDIIPTEASTGDVIGMILQKIEWTSDISAKPPRMKFVMRFKVSRGDGT